MSRKSSRPSNKPRRVDPRQLVFTVIGLLVIVAFVLGMLQSY